MVLVTKWGASTDHVEFNREDDCDRAAQTWVAHQYHKHSAKAWCQPKHK